MSEPRVVELCRTWDRISDTEFERHYRTVPSACLSADIVHLDLRSSPWYDPWALIQFLLILGSKPVCTKPRRIILLSPEALGLGCDETKKENVIARLRFLSDMEFLDRAVELGVTLGLQTCRTEKPKAVSPSDVRQIAPPLAGEDDYGGRPIIPIISISSIVSQLRDKRDELFHKADVIFARYFTEAIVQEAGLGDCLLSELLANALEHGNSESAQRVGYIALRAGLGLHAAKRRDPERYKQRKFARTHHLLGDWRTYFQKYPDDPYFELMVVDRGQGIAATIKQDERLPEHLKESKQAPHTRQHKLIRYALETTSSRYSAKMRQEKDRTEFTGLAAVSHVLTSHKGCLLVREGSCRHVFGGVTDEAGLCFPALLDPTDKTERRLETILGTTVTAVIPMKGTHHTPLGFLPPAASPPKLESGLSRPPALKVFRVRAPKEASDASFLDKECGVRWDTLARRIAAGACSAKAVLVDIASASLMRNELWLGLSKVRRACQSREVPLVLCGIDERAASRLEENATLDQKRIADGEKWILLAFGDEGKIYCIGFFGNNPEHKAKIAEQAAEMFANCAIRASDALPLLKEAHYIAPEATTSYRRATFSWVASLSSIREAFRSSQGQRLKGGIMKTSAWLSNTSVQLDNGNNVADYVCLHSVSQLRDMNSDFVRLLRISASPFDYNFVLGVGPIAQAGARFLGQHLFREGKETDSRKRLNNYAYHDYSSFDHGETSNRLIPAHSKVLILVDGIRSGDHAREVIRHVIDSGASASAVVSVFDLTSDGGQAEIERVPTRYLLELPIRSAERGVKIDYIESPFTHTLVRSPVAHDTDWKVALTKRLAYKYIEGYGLLLQGHVTFFDQHFCRTVPLPYLLNSSSSFLAEIVNSIMTVIDHNEIDCIVYPEHSSISALVDRIMKLPEIGKREVATILCRPAAWPDRSSGYELDLLGRERLAQAKNVLILEDETYTGGSVKSLATLCFEVLEGRLGRLAVYTVIDSMMHTERRVLTRLLREASVKTSDSQQKEQPTRPEIRLYAFMHLSVSPYWNESTCPMCRIIANLSQLLEQSPGPIENRYASNRIAELTPKSMDQDLGARSRLHKLREVLELQRNRMTGSVAISTREGLEMFCEEAYVEGDIAWLVTHINPQHPDSFLDPNVMLALIALLARDMRLLRRVGLSERLLVNINAVLATRVLHAKHLGLLMETLCGWPLHCLQEIWDNLFHTVFEESNDDFVESYGGAHLLLTDVCQRYEHPIRSALLKAFDTQVLELYHQAAPSDRPRRTKVHMAMCLRRTSYWPSQHVRTFGELISELSFLLGFFAPDKIEHRILSRGLDDLLQETEPTKPVRHIHVVQIAEHIRTDLASLVQLEMSALNGLQTNPNYGALLTAITDLQHAYPSMDSPHIGGNELRTIQGCADKIRMLLYVDEEPESLPSVLKKFLNEYRCTPRKMLGHIIEWAGTDQNVTLNNSLSDAELVNEDLLVVLNDEAVCEIFQELTTNLKRAKKRRDDGFTQKRKTDLFEVPPRFEVVVWHEKTIDKLILFLRSPCAKDDFERLTAASGVGLRSLKNAVDFLGHSYEASWDEPTATLTQKFSLRRIHR